MRKRLLSAPIMVEVRAVKDAYVLADSSDVTPIPGDRWSSVPLTPHIALAIREGDLERRPEQPAAQVVGEPEARAKKKKKKKAAKKKTAKRATAKRQAKPAQQPALSRNVRTATEVALFILKKQNPEGYGPDRLKLERAVLQVHNNKNWKEGCDAKGVDPEKLKPPKRDAIARVTGHRVD